MRFLCFGKKKAESKKGEPGYNKKAKNGPNSNAPKKRCACLTLENFRKLNPGYAKAAEYSQFFLTSGKGVDIRRLLIQMKFSRREVTYFFKLFMKIDDDDSGMVTLDEFFKFLKIDWSPFIGKAFHQFDSDQEGMSADQLEPDEWLVGLLNYCTLTPEALARYVPPTSCRVPRTDEPSEQGRPRAEREHKRNKQQGVATSF